MAWLALRVMVASMWGARLSLIGRRRVSPPPAFSGVWWRGLSGSGWPCQGGEREAGPSTYEGTEDQ